jgi:hypothetical protein
MMSKGARVMRKGIMLVGLVTGIAFVAATAWAAAAPTPTPVIPAPSSGAPLYKVAFVAAMAPCDPEDPGTVTLHARGSAGGKLELLGCEEAFSDPISGDTLRIKKGQLLLKKHSGKIILNVQGLPVGQKVQLGLELKSTRQWPATWETGLGVAAVATMPLEVICPVQTADDKGKVIEKTYLDQCAPILGGTSYTVKKVDPIGPPPPGGSEFKASQGGTALNIEVLDATLLDVDTGKVFARAGITR